MGNRLRDAILAVSVSAALFAAGAAVYDLGRRLPPSPEVRPTPTTQVGPDMEQWR